MKWTDSLEIAIALEETHPQIDPKSVNFVDLHQFVSKLHGFEEGNSHCGERVLEAIQMHWIEEKN
jgi:FeS assembly protein IscX|tara:strand:+ start:332 stop:526 length:195 start_codon:yes stop_codon:yes gene_type:complete